MNWRTITPEKVLRWSLVLFVVVLEIIVATWLVLVVTGVWP